MAVITTPVAGSNFGNGLGSNVFNVNNGVYPLNANTRWQWNLTGAESTANAGSDLQLQAIADDGTTIVATPISVNRATGAVTIQGGGASEYFGDGSVSAPSIAFASSHGTGIYYTTNAVNLTSNGVRTLQLATATTGVNYFTMTPSAAGAAVALTAAGSDTDISVVHGSKGAGVVALGGTTAANASVQVPTVASAVNFLSVSGAIASSPVLLTATGTDGTVDLRIVPKSTGSVYLTGTSTTAYGVKVVQTASTAVGLIVTPAATGASATLAPQANTLILGAGAALNTTATGGHVAIPTCAGTPTGVPTGTAIGHAQLIFDTTGVKLWAYKSGVGWVGVVLS